MKMSFFCILMLFSYAVAIELNSTTPSSKCSPDDKTCKEKKNVSELILPSFDSINTLPGIVNSLEKNLATIEVSISELANQMEKTKESTRITFEKLNKIIEEVKEVKKNHVLKDSVLKNVRANLAKINDMKMDNSIRNRYMQDEIKKIRVGLKTFQGSVNNKLKEVAVKLYKEMNSDLVEFPNMQVLKKQGPLASNRKKEQPFPRYH
ncbi:UNVERIFIED_CONTAM: hypothetical protein RMT77_016625 [Armadillidium vulgare]